MKPDNVILCMGSSCYTRGNSQTLFIIQDYLKKAGLEKKVLFKGELCSCNCKEGPNLKIGDEIFHNIDSITAIAIIKDYFISTGLVK